jgi:iron complex transport system substrate-binding protein
VRIVSMLPSATEIVYALGLGDQLVGVTFECDEPPSARAEKRVIVGGRDTSGMTPGEVDSYVREQLAAGNDLYTLDTDALAELAPDLILTQDLCRVCALPSGHVEQALDYLGCQADVLSLDPYSLDDVLDTIAAVGNRAGVGHRASLLTGSLRERIGQVSASVTGLPRPRVAVVEWVDPPFTAGHWIPDMVRAAGGEPVACTPRAPSRQANWADIAAAGPDVVIVAPCGFHLDGASEQARRVLCDLPDVPVWAIDADAIVVRPGPRLAEGVAAMSAILHPDAAPPAPAGSIRLVRRGLGGPRRKFVTGHVAVARVLATAASLAP